MLKAQLDLSVPCPHTQDFEPCMGPGCSDEGEHLQDECCCAGGGKGGVLGTMACSFIFKLLFLHPVRQPDVGKLFKMLIFLCSRPFCITFSSFFHGFIIFPSTKTLKIHFKKGDKRQEVNKYSGIFSSDFLVQMPPPV